MNKELKEKLKILADYAEEQRLQGFQTTGKRLRNARRKENKKPRRKIKKL